MSKNPKLYLQKLEDLTFRKMDSLLVLYILKLNFQNYILTGIIRNNNEAVFFKQDLRNHSQDIPRIFSASLPENPKPRTLTHYTSFKILRQGSQTP